MALRAQRLLDLTAGPLTRGAGGAGAGYWASAEPVASAALATAAPRNVRRVTAA